MDAHSFDFGVEAGGVADHEDAEVTQLSARLVEDMWDTRAWTSLLETAERKSSGVAKCIYERCLKVFPACSGTWLAYLRRQESEGDFDAVEAVLDRCLQITLDAELWFFYVDFVYRTKFIPADSRLARAKSAHAEAAGRGDSDNVTLQTELAAAMELYSAVRHDVENAYEFALSKVGLAALSGDIWESFLHFLSTAPEGHAIETSYKRDALRKAYHRAVAIPHTKTEALWKAYCEFEKSISQAALATKFIAEHQSDAGTAIPAAVERLAIWKRLDMHALPWMPLENDDSSNTAEWIEKYQQQLQLWRSALGFELQNKLMVGKLQLHAYAVLAFRQCLATCKFCPDAWYDYATYLVSPPAVLDEEHPKESKVEAALRVLDEAIAAMPACITLVMATAELCEIHKLHDKCSKLFESCLARLDELVKIPIPASAVALDATKAVMARLDMKPEASSDNPSGCDLLEFPRQHDITLAQQATPLVYVAHMRQARRIGGIDAARAVFKSARTTTGRSPMVFLANAHIEYFANRAVQIARNVIELGRREFPRDINFLLSAADFVATVDDTTNAEAFFEAVLAELPPAESRPIYDRYIDYELRKAQSGGSLDTVLAIEQRRAAVHPHLVGPHARLLSRAMHRFTEFGMLPTSRVDDDFMRRHPYHPFELIAVEPSALRAGALPSYETPATAVTTAFPRAFAEGVIHKDGLFLQAPAVFADALSHVHPKYMTPMLPAHSKHDIRDSQGAKRVLIPEGEQTTITGSKRKAEPDMSAAKPPVKKRGVLGFGV
jgi:hypothetical protein